MGNATGLVRRSKCLRSRQAEPESPTFAGSGETAGRRTPREWWDDDLADACFASWCESAYGHTNVGSLRYPVNECSTGRGVAALTRTRMRLCFSGSPLTSGLTGSETRSLDSEAVKSFLRSWPLGPLSCPRRTDSSPRRGAR